MVCHAERKFAGSGQRPLAPVVTNDDEANTVEGINLTMEYELDGAGSYTAYDRTAFSTTDLSGNHTLKVRYATSGVNPAGADTTLTFTTNRYTVTFESNGGSAVGSATTDVNTPISEPTAPTRTGYTFDNKWYKDSGLTDDWDFANDKVMANTTLFAKWTANAYTVAYDTNGGDGGSTASSTHTYDAAKALTANGFTRTGYTFAGWNMAADNSSISYGDGADVSNLAADNGTTVTLYAKWTQNHYSVTYDGNGNTSGDLPTDSNSYTHNQTVTVGAGSLVKTGCTFAGWNTAANDSGDHFATDATFGITGNVTLYAQWNMNTYTVVYDINSGDGGTTASTIHTYGAVKNLNANGYSKANYAFAGWTTNADGSGTGFADQASILNLTAANGATITLYAKWVLSACAVTFDSQGGSAVAGFMINCGSTITEPAIPTMAGFALSGWYKEPGFVNEWNFSSDVVTGDTILYARWSNISVIKVQSSSTRYGTVTGLGNYANDRNATITAIPKNGYYFVKWMNGRTVVSTSAVFTFPAASNMSLKAYFASIPTPRFKVTAIGYNTVRVSWSLFSKASGYEIYRSTSSRGVYTLIASVGSDVSSYVDTNGLVAGTTYYYKVATLCTAGSTQTSKLSSARSVRPNWPGMTLKAGIINYHTANLSWKSIAEADGYKIFRSTSSRGVYVEIADVTAPTLTYQDAGLSYGSTYYYKVCPYDAVGADKVVGTLSGARSIKAKWPTLRLKPASSITTPRTSAGTALPGRTDTRYSAAHHPEVCMLKSQTLRRQRLPIRMQGWSMVSPTTTRRFRMIWLAPKRYWEQ